MKKALVQMNLAVFLWGFTGVLGRAISLNSTMLVWWRLLITMISLWILYLAQGKARSIPWKSMVMIAMIGTIQALHWVCFYASIKLANVTIALTCLSTTALLAALFEPLVIRRGFDPFEIILGLFAIAGILIIYNTHIEFSTGIIIGLLSAVLTVIVSVFNKKIIDRFQAEQITLYQLSGGFIGMCLLMPLFQFYVPEPWSIPSLQDFIWLLVLSWACTILTFFLYIRALKKISAFTANLALTLEPVYGIILAFMIYQENKFLSRWFYLGFALIALSVVVHTMRLVRVTKRKSVPGAG